MTATIQDQVYSFGVTLQKDAARITERLAERKYLREVARATSGKCKAIRFSWVIRFGAICSAEVTDRSP